MKQFVEFVQKVTELHAGQYRKNGVTPFIAHPIRVAMQAGFGPYHLGTYIALAHDVIEDADGEEFERWVREDWEVPKWVKTNLLIGVKALTKDDSIHPRSAKWEDQIQKVLDCPIDCVKDIKICDRIDNLEDMEHDEFFWDVYLPESWELYEAFQDAGVPQWKLESLGNLLLSFDSIAVE